MRSRVVVRGAAVVAITGVLTGLGVTAAHAAGPGPGSAAVAGDTVQARFSSRFTLHNQLRPGETMTLVEVGGGVDEGRPSLGAAMASGESQAFEVQWRFAYTNAIDATYRITTGQGNYAGTVTVRMELDGWRLPRTSMPDPSRSTGWIVDPSGTDPALTR